MCQCVHLFVGVCLCLWVYVSVVWVFVFVGAIFFARRCSMPRTCNGWANLCVGSFCVGVCVGMCGCLCVIVGASV